MKPDGRERGEGALKFSRSVRACLWLSISKGTLKDTGGPHFSAGLYRQLWLLCSSVPLCSTAPSPLAREQHPKILSLPLPSVREGREGDARWGLKDKVSILCPNNFDTPNRLGSIFDEGATRLGGEVHGFFAKKRIQQEKSIQCENCYK